jgi:hypothetical protein
MIFASGTGGFVTICRPLCYYLRAAFYYSTAALLFYLPAALLLFVTATTRERVREKQ